MNTTYRCLVDEHSYHLYLTIPSIAIMVVLGFMKKRVRLSPDLCNGRPAIPVPVDFLGKDRNRFATVIAFGATAASCFLMFLETINPSKLKITTVSKNMPNTPWATGFKDVFMMLVYGIINFPYLACLNTDYKVIGYTIGLVYTFIRLIVDLFLFLGCSFDEESTQISKSRGLSYMIYGDMLLNLPAVICTALLVGSYGLMLYREVKRRRTNNSLAHLWDILDGPTKINLKDDDEPVAEETDKEHVELLLTNNIHSKRLQRVNEPFYVRLKNKIYESRPGFKFSAQFLSTFLVSFIFIYQLTSLILIVLVGYIRIVRNPILSIFLDYVLAAVILGSFVSMLQLFCLLKSHRKDVLQTYKSRIILPDETIRSRMLVDASLQFCGYQIAYTAIGFLFVTLALMFLLSIPYGIKVVVMKRGQEYVLQMVKECIIETLPAIVVPLLIWIVMVLIRNLFYDKTYPENIIHINNRRCYAITTYFFFFFNVLVGLWSGLHRVEEGARLGLVFLCRLDKTSLMTGYRKLDQGYMAYIGFVNVLVAFKHPVMLCFCQLLLDEKARKPYPGITSIDARPRVSTKSLNRWFLAVMLVRNPSLVRYRRKVPTNYVCIKKVDGPHCQTHLAKSSDKLI